MYLRGWQEEGPARRQKTDKDKTEVEDRAPRIVGGELYLRNGLGGDEHDLFEEATVDAGPLNELRTGGAIADLDRDLAPSLIFSSGPGIWPLGATVGFCALTRLRGEGVRSWIEPGAG